MAPFWLDRSMTLLARAAVRVCARIVPPSGGAGAGFIGEGAANVTGLTEP